MNNYTYNYNGDWMTFDKMIKGHSTKRSLDVWVSINGNKPLIGVITNGTFTLSSATGKMRELALDCENYFQINDAIMPRLKNDKVLFKLVKPVKAPVIVSVDGWITYSELLDSAYDAKHTKLAIWTSFGGDVYSGKIFRGSVEFDNPDQELFHNFLNSEDAMFRYVDTPPPPPKRIICEDI
jgi:hypothetical protein